MRIIFQMSVYKLNDEEDVGEEDPLMIGEYTVDTKSFDLVEGNKIHLLYVLWTITSIDSRNFTITLKVRTNDISSLRALKRDHDFIVNEELATGIFSCLK